MEVFAVFRRFSFCKFLKQIGFFWREKKKFRIFEAQRELKFKTKLDFACIDRLSSKKPQHMNKIHFNMVWPTSLVTEFDFRKNWRQYAYMILSIHAHHHPLSVVHAIALRGSLHD